MSAAFGALPSALTAGVRLFPPVGNLEFLAAADVATSGSRKFIEEISPTVPWAAWLGVSYAVDVIPPPPPRPRVVQVHVDRPVPVAPPSLHKLRGLVFRVGTEEPIPGAIVRFQGEGLPPVATDAEGRFVSAALPVSEKLLAEALADRG